MGGKRPLIIALKGKKLKEEELQEITRALKRGSIVAFPTETVYGVGVDSTSQAAVRALLKAKRRPAGTPFSLHLGSVAQAELVTEDIPPKARDLMETFWPGPLTIILPARDCVLELVRGGRRTVGLRLPAHEAAREIALALNRPLAGTSANISGHLSPTRVEHVLEEMGHSLQIIVDDGPTPVGTESAVIDLSCTPPVVLRLGTVDKEALQEVLGEEVQVERGTAEKPFRLQIPLYVCQVRDLKTLTERMWTGGKVTVGFLGFPGAEYPGNCIVRPLGGELEDLKQLYSRLRDLERQVDVILACPPGEGKFASLLQNRLYKAARGIIRG